VLARTLADVLGGDTYPAIAVRSRDHRLEQAAVGFLDLALARKLGLSVTESNRKTVTNPLELGHAEDAGPADRRNGPLDARPREGRGEQFSEPLLQQRDLPPELVPRPPLGARIGDPIERRAIEALSRPIGLADWLDLKQLLGQRAPPSALDGRPQSSPGRGGDPAGSGESLGVCGARADVGQVGAARSAAQRWLTSGSSVGLTTYDVVNPSLDREGELRAAGPRSVLAKAR
jgi:hypothetical protein